ncbi:LuxR C-terminal-related transcriptional regulator [Microbacterium sp. A82]|uniref:LuxR C-terminal-related transcriptional regulator n=1 Tax=Microbacterium sp. A82 TaxID=3450452 RepID=UPI003F2A9F47
MDTQSQALWAPSPWFLTSPPQSPRGTIPRERLLTRLDASTSDHAVTLIAAPSGYGKTVLLAEWARRREATTAWLTLTRHDHGDEALVLAGILSALRRFTELPSETAVRVALTPDADARALIGRIAEITGSLDEIVVIVIDDAHHAGPSLASGVIDVLTALTAGRLRFALAGTPELTSWFSRVIAGEHTAVLTAADLALTAEEIMTDGVSTPTADDRASAAALREATDGWPIAVHLHRLAGGNEPSLTGAEGLLTDYIAGNVLPRLSPGLADFVLATSVCSRLTPALAGALSGADNAESLLEDCVSQGLFLYRHVDENGSRIYRWHDEFAARCRDILGRADSSRRRALDVTAARWLTPHFPAEAVMHAMRADDAALAIGIIRSSWMRVIIEAGAKSLNVQCLALPATLAAHPEILLIRACCLNLMGDRTGADLLSSQAHAAASTDADSQITHAFASLFLADAHSELASAVDRAKTMLELGGTASGMHAHCLFLLGWSELRLRRDPQSAVRLLESALHEADAARLVVLARRASNNLLFALGYAGNLTRARTRIDSGLAQSEAVEDWQHYDGGIELFARGFTDYWQNRIPEAEQVFLALVAAGGHDASYTALARVYVALCAAIDGRPMALRTARATIAGVSRQEVHGLPWHTYQAFASAELFAAAGDFDKAIAAIEPIRAQSNVPVVRVGAAELMRRAGRLGEAGHLLSALSRAELSISYVAASAHVTAALISHERGDDPRAHRILERALDVAVPEGVIRPFAIADEGLRTLLAVHAGSGTAHEEFIASRLASHGSSGMSDLDHGVVLSAREREIYGFLHTSMTATEIGEALFVSVNTIRTHQRAIYRKLGVSNRRDAIRLRL